MSRRTGALAERRTTVISLRLEDGQGFDCRDLVAQGSIFHLLARPEQLAAPSCLRPCGHRRRKRGDLARASFPEKAGLAVERCQVQQATQLSSSLGIQPDALTTYRNEAQQWAEQAVQAA